MQKLHRLLQPRMMLTYADRASGWRTGTMSAYVSSALSWTFMAPPPAAPLPLLLPPSPCTMSMSRGRSLRAGEGGRSKGEAQAGRRAGGQAGRWATGLQEHMPGQARPGQQAAVIPPQNWAEHAKPRTHR